MHSRTKHIEIRFNFLRDHITKGNCEIEYVDTKHQLVNIFTKPLAKDRFYELRRDLGILEISSICQNSNSSKIQKFVRQ